MKKVPGKEEFFDPIIEFISTLKNIYDESNKYYRGIMTRDRLAYAPIKISYKVDTKPNRQVTRWAINIFYRVVNGEEILVQKYKDIYDPKFNLVEDIVNGKKQKTNMCIPCTSFSYIGLLRLKGY